MPAIKRSFASRRQMKKSTYGARRSLLRRTASVTLNSNDTGYVAPRATDLARNKGPFQPVYKTSLEYSNALTTYAPAAVSGLLSVACNSMYDFDKTAGSIFGNKQPLYYDALMTSSGPYKGYKVVSWETVYTIINTQTVPMTVWALPPTTATAEIDSAAEADNFPGVKRIYLTASTGSFNKGEIVVRGNIKDVWPSSSNDANFVGSYNSDPSGIAYAGLYFQTADQSTNVTCAVAVKHTFYCELSTIDSIVS